MTDVKIRCDDCKFVEDCVDYGWQECKKFTPTPSEPMTKLCDTCEYLKFCARSGIEDVGCDRYQKDTTTNKEWMQTATTEQLAEWLADKLDYCQIMWYWACDKCTWSKKHESCMNDKEKWVEWLKQPHTNE